MTTPRGTPSSSRKPKRAAHSRKHARAKATVRAIEAPARDERTVLNNRGQAAGKVTAAQLKNKSGAVLRKVLDEGAVVITRHSNVDAVLLSVGEYAALVSRKPDPLAALSERFDALVSRMQEPQARQAARDLFDASPDALAEAAVAAARQRG